MNSAIILALVKVGVAIGGMMTAAAYFVLLERRMAAWVQDRHGPNRVGIPLTKIRLWGLGQPLADGVKFIFKEEYTPGHVDKWLYVLAPLSILTAALASFAVVPVGSVLPTQASTFLTDQGLQGVESPIRLEVAPKMDVAMIYIFALSSIAVYGVVLGGWASNNKYSFLGGLRSSAQLIAYELPMGLGILGVVLASNSLNLDAIITEQAKTGCWYGFSQPLGFIVFVIAAFAEAARLPFDLPECEQELVGGYHTEYAGLKLLMFLVAEFLHMIMAAFLIVILFMGGWHFWGLTGHSDEVSWIQAALRVGILSGKIFVVILFFMLTRWSWPRFRFDQLMALAWKIMLPLGIANFVMIAIFEEVRRNYDPSHTSVAWEWGLCLPAWIVCVLGWLVVAFSGTLVTDNAARRNLQAYDLDSQL